MANYPREHDVLCPYFRTLLLRLRESEGCSQEKFAEMLDLSSRSYGNYERGHCLCSVATILRVLSWVDNPMPIIHHCVELLDASRAKNYDS